MVIVSDTRQKQGKHLEKEKYFRDNGYRVLRSKLPFGDYARLDKQTTVIDSKENVVELANNVVHDHARFKAECIGAKEYGIHLIILVEELVNLDEWESPKRKNGTPYTKVSGKTLKKAINTMSERYGVEFRFCTRKDSGAEIVKILEEL